MGAPLDPHEIPDDATGRDLAGFVAEDIARYLGVRLAALLAVIAVIAGLLSESAPTGLKAACVAAGVAGAGLLLVAGLSRWRRGRQWWVIAGVVVVCGGLLAAVYGGSSG